MSCHPIVQVACDPWQQVECCKQAAWHCHQHVQTVVEFVKHGCWPHHHYVPCHAKTVTPPPKITAPPSPPQGGGAPQGGGVPVHQGNA